MGIFFIILSHAMMVFGIVSVIYGAYMAIASTKSIAERIVRGLAFIAGTFAYLAAKTLGISLPSLLVQSVAGGKWFALILLGTVIPAVSGFLLIRYIMACMRAHDAIAIRVMLMVAALVLVMFADVYIAAAAQAGFQNLRPLLPNVTFVLTMLCYIVFEYRPKDPGALG